MALNWHGLGFLFTAKDMASAVVTRIERNLGSLGKTARSVGAGIATAFVAAHVYSGGVQVLKDAFALTDDARKFELTMAQVGVISRASAGQLENLRTTAINMGLSTIHGPQDAADAMKQLVQSGYDAEDAMKTVHSVLRLITASGGDIKDTADAARLLSMVQKTWGVEGEQAIDRISRLANMSNAEFREMETLVSHVLRGTGIKPTMADTFALVGLTRNLAGNMETAATSVGVMMERLGNPRHTKKLEALGIKIFDKDKNAFLQPMDILKQMLTNENFLGLNEREKFTMFGDAFGSRQQKVIQSFFTQIERGFKTAEGSFVRGVEAIDYYRNAIENAAGDAHAFEKATENSFAGAVAFLVAKTKTLRIQIGEALMGAFKPLIVAVGNVLEGVGRALEAIGPDMRIFLARVFLIGTAVLTAVAGLIAFASAIGVVVVIAKVLGITLAGVFAAVSGAALPALVIIGSLTLMGAAFYAAWKNNIGGLKDTFGGFFDKVALGFRVMSQLFQHGGTFGDVQKQLNNPENFGLRDFLMEIWHWLAKIRNFAKGVWEGFVGGLKRLAGGFEVLKGMMMTLLEMFGVSTGSAQDAQNSFRAWGQAGRELGNILAGLASVGVFLLVVGLGMLIDTVKLLQAAWKFLGPAAQEGFEVVLDMFGVFAGLLTGNWTKMFEKMVLLALKSARLLALLPGMSHLAVSATVLEAQLRSSWDARDRAGRGETDLIHRASPLSGYDVSGTPWASPGTAAVEAQNAQFMASARALMGQQAPVVVHNTLESKLVVDGKELASVVNKANREDHGRSMITVPAVAGASAF